MSDAIYCYHLVSLCTVLLVFSAWLISISVNLMSQLCLIHFRMWLLLVATSVLFYWHNESLKWTVLLQGSVFSRSAWLIWQFRYTHSALQCFRLDFNNDPTYLNAKLRCGGLILHSSKCCISLSFLFLWFSSCCWKQKHAQSHSVLFFIFHGTDIH
jgi:hypothetical protein